jgi:putative intracellular protease/amidase
MLTRLKSFFAHAVAISTLPLLFAAFGIGEYLRREHPAQLERAPQALLDEAPRPHFDPARPTVVVLLGADVTEITDFLGPYEMFARVGTFNVVTAAPERRPTLLTGGLRILPHYSLAELDVLLDGRAPAIVVVPNIPNIAEPPNEPLLRWMREQAAAGALVHSWCKGAMALAEAGLLDGKTATAHWGDIDGLERRYPQVSWVRGVRWLEHGQFVISAGITSGIDASLRVISRIAGDAEARRVARELRYPNYHFAIDPSVEQYTLRAADLILVANASFGRIGRERIGLALYSGVGELDLSSLYDAHGYTMVADIEAVGEHSIVETAHGLTLMPSIVLSEADGPARIDDLDRFVIAGVDARERATPLTRAVAEIAPSLHAQYLHADEPERFGLEPALEDLALSADIATARFAQRRMEHRSRHLTFEGDTVRTPILLLPLLLAGTGVVVLRLTRRARRGHCNPRPRSARAAPVMRAARARPHRQEGDAP